MYNVLLLHEANNYDVRVKEYLSLGECHIEIMCLSDRTYLNHLHGVDIVLMDCDDILTCLKSVREIRSHEQFPIVVLSEQDDEWSRGLRAGSALPCGVWASHCCSFFFSSEHGL